MLPALISQEIPPEAETLEEDDEGLDEDELDELVEDELDELVEDVLEELAELLCCDEELSALAELLSDEELKFSDEYVGSAPPTGAPPAGYSPEVPPEESDFPLSEGTDCSTEVSTSLTVFSAQPVDKITAAKIKTKDFLILFIINLP